MFSAKKLALGCAQFGCDYGITNTTGKVAFNVAKDCVDYARQNGIDTIDTAITYGDSEVRLGKIGVKAFKVVSKITVSQDLKKDLSGFAESLVVNSLETLGIDSLHGMLFHNFNEICDNQRYIFLNVLLKLQRQGLIKKVGVSLYDPWQIEKIFEYFTPEIVQIPLNILNRQFADEELLNFLKNKKVEIHVRSVFLQGLLLKSFRELPKEFSKWDYLWEFKDKLAFKNKCSFVDLCLSFVQSFSQIDRIVVGVQNSSQLAEICASKYIELRSEDLKKVKINDSALVDPRQWKKQ